MNNYGNIKYYAARFIYKRQNQQTPSGRTTWKQWWEKRFSDDYRAYITGKAQENNDG
jgi:hypothetical protein